jgi:hypothetical protein
MRTLRSLFVVVMVTGLTILPSAASAATLPSSTAGNIVFQDWMGPSRAWWTAVEGVEGTAGSFGLDQGIFSFAADVTCVVVVSPTEAYMGGPVTSSSQSTEVGRQMLAYVVDGGPSQTDDLLWVTNYDADTCADLGTYLPGNGPFVVSGGGLAVSKGGMLASATLLTPSATTAHVGDPITLTGRLGVAGETAEGRSISITRSVDGGGPTPVATVTTGSDGTFETSDIMPAGPVVYTAAFATTATVLGSSASAALTFEKRTTTLALSVSQRTITFGRSIALTATLAGGDPGDEVSFFAQPIGDPKRKIGQVATDGAGMAVLTVTPAASTTYSATFAGTSVAAASSSPMVKTTVAVRWTAKAVGGYATSKGYRLYHYTNACVTRAKGCPTFAYTMLPRHSRAPVRYETQVFYGGKWHGSVFSFRLTEDGNLRTYTLYEDRGIIGLRFRDRVIYRGDDNHTGATSAWVYWKVTD